MTLPYNRWRRKLSTWIITALLERRLTKKVVSRLLWGTFSLGQLLHAMEAIREASKKLQERLKPVLQKCEEAQDLLRQGVICLHLAILLWYLHFFVLWVKAPWCLWIQLWISFARHFPMTLLGQVNLGQKEWSNHFDCQAFFPIYMSPFVRPLILQTPNRTKQGGPLIVSLFLSGLMDRKRPSEKHWQSAHRRSSTLRSGWVDVTLGKTPWYFDGNFHSFHSGAVMIWHISKQCRYVEYIDYHLMSWHATSR